MAIIHPLSVHLLGEKHPKMNCIAPIKAKMNDNATFKAFFCPVRHNVQMKIDVITIVKLFNNILKFEYVDTRSPVITFKTNMVKPIYRTNLFMALHVRKWWWGLRIN